MHVRIVVCERGVEHGSTGAVVGAKQRAKRLLEHGRRGVLAQSVCRVVAAGWTDVVAERLGRREAVGGSGQGLLLSVRQVGGVDVEIGIGGGVVLSKGTAEHIGMQRVVRRSGVGREDGRHGVGGRRGRGKDGRRRVVHGGGLDGKGEAGLEGVGEKGLGRSRVGGQIAGDGRGLRATGAGRGEGAGVRVERGHGERASEGGERGDHGAMGRWW